MDQRETTAPETNVPTSPRPSAVSRRRRLFGLLELSIASVIVACDQVTKALVRAHVSEYQDLEVIPGVLNFTHVRNSGAAFGLFNAIDFPYKSAVIAIAAAAALVAIAAYAARLAPAQTLARVGLALILGGAVGNLIDRVAVGYVLDYVDVYWRSYHFWAFNVADAAITAGVGVMVLDMLGLGSHVSKTL
ncbi:MAG: signal peptidase II [Bacteroidales bacterium]